MSGRDLDYWNRRAHGSVPGRLGCWFASFAGAAVLLIGGSLVQSGWESIVSGGGPDEERVQAREHLLGYVHGDTAAMRSATFASETVIVEDPRHGHLECMEARYEDAHGVHHVCCAVSAAAHADCIPR